MTNFKNPRELSQQPWGTLLTAGACVLIYLTLLLKNDSGNPATLAQFGYVSADNIWRGQLWGLLTSAFVHLELWHVAFNVYWLWTLGRLLEKEIGTLAFLAFFASAAFVSSSFQLAFTDTTGIGASGVGYAIFGFMWVTRGKYPNFARVVDDRTVKVFIVWLIGCLFATAFKLWEVGNEAHVAGLLFGMAVAGALSLRYRPYLTLSALILLVSTAASLLFWCPWSITWLSTKAYDAQVAGRYPEALQRYSEILRRDPKSAWAYLNRSGVYSALLKYEEAAADLKKATELDPASVKQLVPGKSQSQ